MNDVHSAARTARAKTSGGSLLFAWLIAALVVLMLSATVDAFSAQAAFWIAAKPFERAGIGAGGALLVVLLAHTTRLILTRKTPPTSNEEAR